jgi:hypothetical protein
MRLTSMSREAFADRAPLAFFRGAKNDHQSPESAKIAIMRCATILPDCRGCIGHSKSTSFCGRIWEWIGGPKEFDHSVAVHSPMRASGAPSGAFRYLRHAPNELP